MNEEILAKLTELLDGFKKKAVEYYQDCIDNLDTKDMADHNMRETLIELEDSLNSIL